MNCSPTPRRGKYVLTVEALEGRTVPSANLAGDFNGDGFADLAVGIPAYDVGATVDAGAVRVLYGSALGLTDAGSQLWTQDNLGLGERSEAGDRFGSALAVGDFNGDGYADLAIGIPYESVVSRDPATTLLRDYEEAGAVAILYGSAAGLTAAGSQLWAQNSAGTPHRNETFDHFGFALAAADFNGDGRADLAVGTPGNRGPDGARDCGSVMILCGSAAGLTADGSRAFQQNSSGVRDTPEGGDQFGFALATGDFNHDGCADLAIAAPFEDLDAEAGTKTDAGAVHILFGSTAGITTVDAQFLNLDAWGMPAPAEAGDQFAWTLAAGDFNGDGYADLAMGAPGKDADGFADAGAVLVMQGADAGLVRKGMQWWTQSALANGQPAQAGAAFGGALATGDFNGDHYADLAIGAPGATVGGFTAAGGVNVVLGASGGLKAKKSQFWTQTNVSNGQPVEAGAGFGGALTAGDFNGDGRADLAVAAPRATVGGAASAGGVSILYGSSTGLVSKASQFWSAVRFGLGDELQRDAFFGAALASGMD